MRSTWSFRLVRALVALWFVASGGELGRAHACPTHGGAVGTPGQSHASHAGHAGHAAGGTHASATRDDGTRDAPHGCTCQGDCCGSSQVAPIAAPPALVAACLAMHQSAGLPRAWDAPAGRQVHVLPFAIGPPDAAPTA